MNSLVSFGPLQPSEVKCKDGGVVVETSVLMNQLILNLVKASAVKLILLSF